MENLIKAHKGIMLPFEDKHGGRKGWKQYNLLFCQIIYSVISVSQTLNLSTVWVSYQLEAGEGLECAK